MLRRLWKTSPELIATALVMLVVLAGAGVGLVADPTVITGAPAWLKPAKFAASIVIYTVTLAWIFTLLPEWRRTRRVIGWATAITMLLEMAIIATQAWRGTTSHFNVGTTFDAWLFGIMGAAILSQTLSTIAVAVALWRTRFDDVALGWALRAGMVITIVGALTGGLMTRPTTSQIEAAKNGEALTIAGAHTVGASDGGPGLVGTGWSTGHGDLRVPHFVGLHALQVLPVLALLLSRRRLDASTRVRLVWISAASYGSLYAILVVQALRGVSVVAPDGLTMVLLVAWVTVTALAVVATAAGLSRPARTTAVV